MLQAKLDFVELVKAYEHLKSTRGAADAAADAAGRSGGGGGGGFRTRGGGRSADDINAQAGQQNNNLWT